MGQNSGVGEEEGRKPGRLGYLGAYLRPTWYKPKDKLMRDFYTILWAPWAFETGWLTYFLSGKGLYLHAPPEI